MCSQFWPFVSLCWPVVVLDISTGGSEWAQLFFLEGPIFVLNNIFEYYCIIVFELQLNRYNRQTSFKYFANFLFLGTISVSQCCPSFVPFSYLVQWKKIYKMIHTGDLVWLGNVCFFFLCVLLRNISLNSLQVRYVSDKNFGASGSTPELPVLMVIMLFLLAIPSSFYKDHQKVQPKKALYSVNSSMYTSLIKLLRKTGFEVSQQVYWFHMVHWKNANVITIWADGQTGRRQFSVLKLITLCVPYVSSFT